MKNKKYTIKYSKPNHSNTNTSTQTHEAQLTNTHPLIKTSIRKTIATCLTFSLVVSVVGYAQALNKTGEDNSSKDNASFVETTSPHYIAIKNFQTQIQNYWDINNIGNISPDKIFYVDMSKIVKNNTEEELETVIAKDNRWPVLYHLSLVRQNILTVFHKYKISHQRWV